MNRRGRINHNRKGGAFEIKQPKVGPKGETSGKRASQRTQPSAGAGARESNQRLAPKGTQAARVAARESAEGSPSGAR